MHPVRSFLIALVAVALFALPALAGEKPAKPDYQAQINALDAHVIVWNRS